MAQNEGKRHVNQLTDVNKFKLRSYVKQNLRRIQADHIDKFAFLEMVEDAFNFEVTLNNLESISRSMEFNWPRRPSTAKPKAKLPPAPAADIQSIQAGFRVLLKGQMTLLKELGVEAPQEMIDLAKALKG